MIWRCFKLDGKQEKKMFWTHFEFDVSNTGKGQKKQTNKKKRLEKLRNAIPRKKKKKKDPVEHSHN